MVVVALVKGSRELATVYKAIELAGGIKDIAEKYSRALIKVNFITTKTYETGVTTDSLIVEGLIRKAREVFDQVFVVESDASMTDADKACEITGIKEVCERNETVFLNLRREKDRVKLPIPGSETLSQIKVPKIVVESAVINAAKLKTHRVTGVSLGMKNMFGLLPEKMKFKYHLRNISKVVVDINTVLKPQFTIIDGFYALEGPGPTSGTPVKMDLLVAGRDVVAVDATACRVMGVEPTEIYHIRRAHEKGLGEIDEARINVVGAKVEEVKRRFRRG
ncbi:MAG TPA: DUF362 domain-containing protein [Candidatus Paceibacterota bacterium]|nr:DUF362 domain-containing protein [Candidatus Paceibacterota bacterium]